MRWRTDSRSLRLYNVNIGHRSPSSRNACNSTETSSAIHIEGGKYAAVLPAPHLKKSCAPLQRCFSPKHASATSCYAGNSPMAAMPSGRLRKERSFGLLTSKSIPPGDIDVPTTPSSALVSARDPHLQHRSARPPQKPRPRRQALHRVRPASLISRSIRPPNRRRSPRHRCPSTVEPDAPSSTTEISRDSPWQDTKMM